MRNDFCRAMVALAARENYFFLTGDLGFMALEPLEKALGVASSMPAFRNKT